MEHFIAFEGGRPGWLDYERELASAPPLLVGPAIAEGDLISINYTSGTTSRPKGVMITHRNAWMNAVGVLVHCPLTQADRYLWTLPMFHANGWGFVWIVTAVGGTHVCLRKVEAPSIHAQVERERITMLCAAPTVLIGIANGTSEEGPAKRSNVRVLTAGAPPAAATIELMEEELGWEITQVYGLTETAPFVSVCEPKPEDKSLIARDRARLKARQGVETLTSGELRVVDEADIDVPRDGQSLGEIVVRGNVVMKGYHNDLQATQTAFRGGWFRTGDAAVVHQDGYVEIRDRYKDVIISGGENISSIEIEGVLLRHSAVLEAAVVGIPHEKWGEAPKAFIVLRGGRSTTELEMREFCRMSLAHFKVPHRFEFVIELPKTATGKIQKFALRQGGSAIHRQ